MLKTLLAQRNFFKLVCGAGNEDSESVKRLVYTYAKAGCKVFDLSAREEILDAAKEAQKLSGMEDLHYCVSVGIKGDPHINKAQIDYNKCIKCGSCYKLCPNDAISEYIKVRESRCIGCVTCAKNCPKNAIRMVERDADVKSILPYMVSNGVEILELHVTGQDKADLDYKWKIINECNPMFASICIDRENLSNKVIISRIKEMLSQRAPYTTIIQADGIPMSGSDDSYKTTLQAVAMAEIIQNAKLPVYITVSGGTNSKTAELCSLCGIEYSGIAIGSWARKIVKPYLKRPDFWSNNLIQDEAVKVAEDLIEKSRYQHLPSC